MIGKRAQIDGLVKIGSELIKAGRSFKAVQKCLVHEVSHLGPRNDRSNPVRIYAKIEPIPGGGSGHGRTGITIGLRKMEPDPLSVTEESMRRVVQRGGRLSHKDIKDLRERRAREASKKLVD